MALDAIFFVCLYLYTAIASDGGRLSVSDKEYLAAFWWGWIFINTAVFVKAMW